MIQLRVTVPDHPSLQGLSLQSSWLIPLLAIWSNLFAYSSSDPRNQTSAWAPSGPLENTRPGIRQVGLSPILTTLAHLAGLQFSTEEVEIPPHLLIRGHTQLVKLN